MSRTEVLHAVLSALTLHDGSGHPTTGIAIDGCTEAEIVTALGELRRDGYVRDFALTDEGRRLLRRLAST